ncbi:hypothetical protein NJBCHELONAE_11840 [Mycobacteroides chelonae]|nr:hypothetical protein NJBCHELONAE_11840 [Mycobacteroides chelonae]
MQRDGVADAVMVGVDEVCSEVHQTAIGGQVHVVIDVQIGAERMAWFVHPFTWPPKAHMETLVKTIDHVSA